MPLIHLDESGKKTFLRLLRNYIFKYKSWFPYIFLFSIIYASTQGALALMLEPLIDKVFTVRDPFWFVYAPLIMCGIFILRGVGSAGATFLIGKLSRNVIFDLREKLFAKYLSIPTQYYDKTNDADLTAKMTFHVEQIANTSGRALRTIVEDSTTIVILLAVMLYKSWQLFLFVFAIIPILYFVIRKVSALFKRYSSRILGSVSTINHVTEEAVVGQKVIKISGGHETETLRFKRGNEENKKSNIKVFLTNAGSNLLVQIIAGIAVAAILFFASRYTELTTGEFMAFLSSLLLINTPIKKLLNVNEILQLGLASANSIFQVMDQSDELDQGMHSPSSSNINLRFNEVSFAYPESDIQVLTNVSFNLKQGKMLALVGSSGSGKSTIASLVPRFYMVRQGEILLNGRDIKEYKLEEYRELVAYVSQEIFLFNDTVANNIAYPKAAESCMDEVMNAAKAAHVLEFVDAMAEGMETIVGDRGVLLSGGQRQRIAIARAIMKNAPLLILDEATSALDTESERLVQDALSHLMQGRTSLVIAHRLSTIEMADEILVFNKGEIIERGSHNDLVKQNGQYARLQQLQSGVH